MAELRGLIEANEYKLKLPTANSLGNTLSRAEIEAVLTDNGITFPVQDVSFFIIGGDGTAYDVSYIGVNYHYIKLKSAT